MTLNMFDLTPLFSPSAFPPSYSMPAEPPSPDLLSSFSLNSSSISATVFFLDTIDDSVFFSKTEGLF